MDVAARREGARADFVQADLRWPPFAPGSFDLVYCLGVLHHLEDPLAGLKALVPLVRPGGEVRLYLYRALTDAGGARRALLAAVTQLRRLTTRLPFGALHASPGPWPLPPPSSSWSPGAGCEHAPGGSPDARAAPGPVQTRWSRSGWWWRNSSTVFAAPLEFRYERHDVEALLQAAGLETGPSCPSWAGVHRAAATV